MFKKEYLFIFVVIGLSIAYAILTLINLLTGGKWLKIANKKIAIGAMIVAFTAILNCGSIAFAQEVSPDPAPRYATMQPTPVYGTKEPTAPPQVDYATAAPTPDPQPEYGIGTPTPDPQPEYGTATPTPDPQPEYAAPSPTPNIIPLYGVVTPGDVNSDGAVDIIDALLIAQYYVGLKPRDFDAAAADVNCDAKIDIIDALLVAQYYVNLIREFPCNDET